MLIVILAAALIVFYLLVDKLTRPKYDDVLRDNDDVLRDNEEASPEKAIAVEDPYLQRASYANEIVYKTFGSSVSNETLAYVFRMIDADDRLKPERIEDAWDFYHWCNGTYMYYLANNYADKPYCVVTADERGMWHVQWVNYAVQSSVTRFTYPNGKPVWSRLGSERKYLDNSLEDAFTVIAIKYIDYVLNTNLSLYYDKRFDIFVADHLRFCTSNKYKAAEEVIEYILKRCMPYPGRRGRRARLVSKDIGPVEGFTNKVDAIRFGEYFANYATTYISAQGILPGEPYFIYEPD